MSSEIKCERCGKKWVPNFVVDEYEIDGMTLCEYCAMPIFMDCAEPEVISEDRATSICCKGQGEKVCAFLGFGGQYTCLKHTTFQKNILVRLESGQMGAKGNNCSGLPAFKPIMA
jgi:hypothetical protein